MVVCTSQPSLRGCLKPYAYKAARYRQLKYLLGVGAMVARILRLDAPPKPADAADALALAITHIWRGGSQARIDAALAAAGRRTR